jgi:hypothetical protein
MCSEEEDNVHERIKRTMSMRRIKKKKQVTGSRE